jgi:hypothetical protein
MPNVTIPGTGGITLTFRITANTGGTATPYGTIWDVYSSTSAVAMSIGWNDGGGTPYGIVINGVKFGIVTGVTIRASHFIAITITSDGSASLYFNNNVIPITKTVTYSKNLTSVYHRLCDNKLNPGNLMTTAFINNFYYFPRILSYQEINTLYNQ